MVHILCIQLWVNKGMHKYIIQWNVVYNKYKMYTYVIFNYVKSDFVILCQPPGWIKINVYVCVCVHMCIHREADTGLNYIDIQYMYLSRNIKELPYLQLIHTNMV